METGIALNNKGQLSIEFMLILIVSIVYINNVIFPTIDFGQTTLNEIYGLGQTRLVAQKIANTVDSLSLQTTDAQQTILVNIPKDGKIECGTGAAIKHIKFTFIISPENESEKCQDDPATASVVDNILCTKNIPVKIPNLTCDSTSFPLLGPQQKQLVVKRIGTGITIT